MKFVPQPHEAEGYRRAMCGGGCSKLRRPAGRGGGLESYSAFVCIGAPGSAVVTCALPLLPTDPASKDGPSAHRGNAQLHCEHLHLDDAAGATDALL